MMQIYSFYLHKKIKSIWLETKGLISNRQKNTQSQERISLLKYIDIPYLQESS